MRRASVSYGRSSRFDDLVHRAPFEQPRKILVLGVLFDLFQELDRFGLVTRFAWIILRDHQFYFDRDHEFVGSNQPTSPDSFARDSHSMEAHEIPVARDMGSYGIEEDSHPEFFDRVPGRGLYQRECGKQDLNLHDLAITRPST